MKSRILYIPLNRHRKGPLASCYCGMDVPFQRVLELRVGGKVRSAAGGLGAEVPVLQIIWRTWTLSRSTSHNHSTSPPRFDDEESQYKRVWIVRVNYTIGYLHSGHSTCHESENYM